MDTQTNKAKIHTLRNVIIIGVLIGIVLAAAVPYYLSYLRTQCDRAASSDLFKLTASTERLGTELIDLNLRFDNDETGPAFAGQNALQYLVGTYYGWRGGDSRCRALLRVRIEHRGYWIVQSCAEKGSQPRPGLRYIFQAGLAGGDMPATIGDCGPDAGDGTTLTWNSYPARNRSGREMCYVQSMVSPENPQRDKPFSVQVPCGGPCQDLERVSQLCDACRKGDLDRVKELLMNVPKGEYSLYTLPFCEAARKGHLNVVSLFVDNALTGTPRGEGLNDALDEACRHGCVELAQVLLARGADVNAHSCRLEGLVA